MQIVDEDESTPDPSPSKVSASEEGGAEKGSSAAFVDDKLENLDAELNSSVSGDESSSPRLPSNSAPPEQHHDEIHDMTDLISDEEDDANAVPQA